ncbi:WXG100 family type VII secretion target [Paractinoplanes rishiriensis]|uniref:Outer membrane channel protein CpnT-like N-terminal domain-containing protein n=1 Tax=Paractinoplanes rishiriensis TaxID=1050105 RepID=A0A919MSH4_9ACTN|nr:hypothetical protein [Actinoplanes rishiriensis]GIE98196.1 hypothetical protein Ari01nite_56610 [Actinoplanes rishiriensis]
MDPPPWSGVWLAEDIELIAQGVRDRSWVDGGLGAVSAGLDALALVSDPLGGLLQYGIAWLIEHVKPLSEALDWLAGDPAAIAGHAQVWRNVAATMRAESDELARAVRFDLSEWQGAASDAYRIWIDNRDQALEALGRAAGTMAEMTEGAGLLIASVRTMVRDAIATVVSRLIVYAVELGATMGFATPLVVEQVATLCASWAARIGRWLRDLIGSLRNLGSLVRQLGEAVQDLVARLRSTPDEVGLLRQGDGIARNGVKILMTRQNVLTVAAKYGIDMHGVSFTLDKLRRGSGSGKELYGVTLPNGSITLARDAFVDEEQLARTLAHERFHLDELHSGLPYPWDDVAREAYERRAYAFEKKWWREHKHLLEAE